MKFIIFLTILAFAFAFVQAELCKGGSDNKPESCSGDEKVAHGDDASASWNCVDGTPTKVACESGKCFNAEVSDCAPCSSFQWVPPCEVIMYF